MGKSALAWALTDLIPNFRDRRRYLYETAQVDLSMFPSDFQLVDDVDAVEPDSVVLIEDLGRIFQSRGSGHNAELPRWLGIISHKRIVVVFTIQNFSDCDISLFRSQNFIELHKLMWDEDLGFERPEFRDKQIAANLMIRRYARLHPEIPLASFVYSPRYSEVVAFPLAPWWTDECAHFLRNASVRREVRA